MQKGLRIFSRIVLGLTFIMSGFVKGVDPLGTKFKIIDYLGAYEILWLEPLAMVFAMILVVVEFTLGVMILLNLWPKLSTWLISLMMLFFTCVTAYDAIYLPVPDCGCFGDFIKMTATETFLKNVVLDVFILILIFTRKQSKPSLSLVQQYLWTTLIILGFFGFSMHSVNHLPPIDFRYWKEGKDLTLASSSPATVYLVYQNKETGEEQSFLSEELPWEDSVWMSEWEFKEQLIDQDEAMESHDLQILDEYGEDITDFTLLNSEYQFIVCVPSIYDTNEEGLIKIMTVADQLREYPYSWILLSGSFEEEISESYKRMGHSLPYGQADDIVLKTMVRANPGVLLLKDGIILKKWHHSDFPDAQLLLENYSDFIN
jgi:uncharacterized membrane protein YphA (DoxX/SURF4 family)